MIQTDGRFCSIDCRFLVWVKDENAYCALLKKNGVDYLANGIDGSVEKKVRICGLPDPQSVNNQNPAYHTNCSNSTPLPYI